MRILPLLLVGLSALALGACDELKGSRQASADCCCKTCPTPPPTQPAAQPAATPPAEAEAKAETVKQTEARTTVRKHKALAHRRVQRTGGGYHAGGYRYRSGTEGVGYLDEDLAGGPRGGSYRGGSYRRVEVDERETYSERYSSSESGYAYGSRYAEGGSGYASGYSEGSYDSAGGHRRGGHKRRRDRDRSYVGTDRYGYLTWPGKTP